MAKESVNKFTLVRDYLGKYPQKRPTAIAQQINDEKGVKVTGKFVATVKTKLKQISGSATTGSAAAAPRTKPPAAKPAKKKPAPASVKSATAKASASAAGLSQHIANLKAAA